MQLKDEARRARTRRSAMAADTVRIISDGGYQAPDGGQVELADDIAHAIAGTRLYLPDEPVEPGASPAASPVIEVTNETTLAAARRIGGEVAALVFASAKNPGGGFLSGAEAQEESLARSSALYACQRAAREFYDYHRDHRDLRYSDRVIYSPRVPVFRDGAGELLERPYPVSFLTAAAPNNGAISMNQPEAVSDVPAILRARADRVLEIAAAHGHVAIVLGAWGCGVFRNDPAIVAAAFANSLATRRFDHIVFAVHDRLPGGPVRAAFGHVFSGAC